MNTYGFLAAFLAGCLVFYFDVLWLAFLLFAIAIVVLIYNPIKSNAKTAWDQAKAAPGSSPEDKFWGDYSTQLGKKTAEWLIPKQDTQYNAKDAIHKMHPASKNFFSELKALFK